MRVTLVVLVSLALVAVPAGWSAILALWAFQGCFLTCSDPEPGVGLVWLGVTLVLLAAPVAAGLLAARSRHPLVLLAALLVPVTIVGTYLGIG